MASRLRESTARVFPAPMTYICIQAQADSLGGYTMTDAEITERKNLL